METIRQVFGPNKNIQNLKTHRCGSNRYVQLNGAKTINLMRYIMKKYKKPQLVAKNNPTGSFAAGCPTDRRGIKACYQCEIAK